MTSAGPEVAAILFGIANGTGTLFLIRSEASSCRAGSLKDRFPMFLKELGPGGRAGTATPSKMWELGIVGRPLTRAVSHIPLLVRSDSFG
jgi:hypothetical protein